MLYNEECYPTNYDTLDFCAWGVHIRTRKLGQIRKWHVVARCRLVLWVFYNEKTIQQHFILHVTILET